MENSRKKRAVYVLLILAFSYLFFFHHLGSYSLKEPDEGRYAEIPREMIEQGDYIVPHLDYVRYFEKPPLLYWACALSYKLMGANEWSFRLPNAFFSLACVLAVYLFAARRFSEETAFVSSSMLASSFGFFGMSRAVTIDMLLTFLLSASLLSFYEFYLGNRRRYLYLFYAFLALSVLAKGPVGIVLLGVSIGLFLVMERRISFLKKMAAPRPVLLFAVIAVPWFILVCLKEPQFFQFFFIDQNLTRFLTTEHNRSGPIYYFIPVIIGGLFPWSFFIPRAAGRLWRSAEARLFLIWSGVVFLFFSVSGSKLVPYILPIFPALSIVLARFFVDQWGSRQRFRIEGIAYALFFFLLALGAFLAGSGILAAHLPDVPEASVIASSLKAPSLIMAGLALIMLILFLSGCMRSFRLFSTGSGFFLLW